MKTIIYTLAILLIALGAAEAQSELWHTEYVTFDDALNGTGYQTTSMAVIAPNRFVAMVCQTPTGSILDNLFDPPGNYLVGYWDADSANGRVDSPINGEQTQPAYGTVGQFTEWTSGLDGITLDGAYQMAAGGGDNYVYVANNDENHNILVFELTESGVVSTDFRMQTGLENIFAIEVDDNGYVYVCDHQGSDEKTNEIRVYAGINADGTTWGDFNGRNDEPVATIDLPPGTYLGLTVSGDGSRLYVSASSERSIWHYKGSPAGGYSLVDDFDVTLSEDDVVGNGGSGVPSFLGLGYMEDPPSVVAAVDTFLLIGSSGGYPYGRIYRFDPNNGNPLDSIDVAEWNFALTGDYSSGSGNGLAGGFTSMVDVDIENSEQAVYSQTYYGWAVEKWVFAGDLTGIEPVVAQAIPERFALRQNYPNPFNPATTIEFDLAEPAFVTLVVYNTLGQTVATLVEGQLAADFHRVTFNAGNLPSGIYFYHLQAGAHSAVQKMMLMR